MKNEEKVLIVDFGGQYKELIARRVRECGVLSLIHSQGQVLSERYEADGTHVDCLLDATLYRRVLAQLGIE